MTIIDSANMQCNSCGVTASHPIMYMPDGWVIDRFTDPIRHYCSLCVPTAGTNLCTKCGNILFSTDCWCYPPNWEVTAARATKHDSVNHPSHYTSHPSGIECIQITEHFSFCVGNAIKYLWRADLKNGIEDLEKAKWYIEREIKRRKSNG